jgi:SAM-dependent methyltransferase
MALAEYYGDVLADCPDEDEDRPARRASTEVAKDLQFYPTPQAVIDRIISNLDRLQGSWVLEPSCGDGRIMDSLRKAGAQCLGVEVDPGRAAAARAKGHSVVLGNFLETGTSATFDLVVMNPPFYGRHYAKHIAHALKFLKPGGRLVCILPASARYDHGIITAEWLAQHGAEFARWENNWTDLPVGSFSESGTNINTTILNLIKKGRGNA